MPQAFSPDILIWIAVAGVAMMAMAWFFRFIKAMIVLGVLLGVLTFLVNRVQHSPTFCKSEKVLPRAVHNLLCR